MEWRTVKIDEFMRRMKLSGRTTTKEQILTDQTVWAIYGGGVGYILDRGD